MGRYSPLSPNPSGTLLPPHDTADPSVYRFSYGETPAGGVGGAESFAAESAGVGGVDAVVVGIEEGVGGD